MSESEPQDFESTLAALEEVVKSLEEGELTLADQLKAYERGTVLSKQCQQLLENATLKVEELTANLAAGDEEDDA